MIQPQELRIGNWVKENATGKHIRVGCIDDDSINPLLNNCIVSKARQVLRYDWLEPIPLTEDWLIRLGFDNSCFENSDYCKILREHTGVGEALVFDLDWTECNLYHFDRRRSEEPETISFLTSPKHVHQLQNLYHALTGEELTIDEG